MTSNPSHSGHLPINGLSLHHEVHGELDPSKRRPLLLIPGASGVLQQAPAVRLVIMPATSHIGISGESAVSAPTVSAFLDDVTPTTPDLF